MPPRSGDANPTGPAAVPNFITLIEADVSLLSVHKRLEGQTPLGSLAPVLRHGAKLRGVNRDDDEVLPMATALTTMTLNHPQQHSTKAALSRTKRRTWAPGVFDQQATSKSEEQRTTTSPRREPPIKMRTTLTRTHRTRNYSLRQLKGWLNLTTRMMKNCCYHWRTDSNTAGTSCPRGPHRQECA